MSLIAVADFALYMRQAATTEGFQAVIDAAEALVAGHIGASAIAERAINVLTYSPRTKASLELAEGPVTAVTSVLVDGLALAGVQSSFWAIAHPDGFSKGAKVEVTGKAGWTALTLPGPVRQAVMMVAASIFNRPDGGVSGTEGVTKVTFFKQGALTADVVTLLQPYRRPVF